jgi:peptidoglycan/LPS O-acetylase OafA/YrhL
MQIHFPPRGGPGGRLPVLDGIKGLALVLVLLYHSGGVLGWPNYLHGEVGVDLFLLVTGFLLVWRARAQPVGAFLRRRFFRIYPTYWFALTLFLLLHHHYFGEEDSFGNILFHAFGLHGFGPPAYFSAINDSFWFISILVLTYGLFLALRRWLDRGGTMLVVCSVLTAGFALAYQAAGNSGGVVELANRIPTVFLGFLAGAVATGGCEFKADWKLAALPLTLSALYYVRGFLVFYPLTAIGVILLYLSFDRMAGALAPLRWVRSALSFLGVYSYEIYLLHQPVIRDYNRLFLHNWLQAEPTPGELGAGILVGLAVVIPASVLLHWLIERGAQALRPFCPGA